jgi:hypothetical protein
MEQDTITPTNFIPHAYITLSNCGGIELMLTRSNDGVFYRFNYGQDLTTTEIFEAEIVYINDEDNEDVSEAGFYHGEDESIFYSLNEAIKIPQSQLL